MGLSYETKRTLSKSKGLQTEEINNFGSLGAIIAIAVLFLSLFLFVLWLLTLTGAAPIPGMDDTTLLDHSRIASHNSLQLFIGLP